VPDVSGDRVDIVVGVASYNSAGTVGDVVRTVREGLDGHFSGTSACIVLADGGSTDRTLDLTREALGGGCNLVTTAYEHPAGQPLRAPYHGQVGRSEAVRAVLQAAQARDAKVCVLLDAGLTSLAPAWIARLVDPILREAFDYASARYLRHPYEGAITKSIVAPMFQALYGVGLRQPATGEFGCSARLLNHALAEDFWTADGAETGIDLWLASDAATSGHRICEADLGVRAHAVAPGGPDLSTTIGQVVGALFADLERRADMWQRVRESAAVPVFGELPATGIAVPDFDRSALLESFQLGYRGLRDVWAWILPPRVVLQIKRLADMPAAGFRIEDPLWARIIYDFAIGYRGRTMPRDHLLGALTPLYLGWLASFIGELPADATPISADLRVEELTRAFEREKPYLISRWRWPERFRS
jgi:glycosyltransferase involved in cell wall biosynthesis